MKIKSIFAKVKAVLYSVKNFFKAKANQVIHSRVVFKVRVTVAIAKWVAIVAAIFLVIYGIPFYYMVVATSGIFCFISAVLYAGYASYVSGVIKYMLIKFAQHVQMNNPIKDVQQPQMITVN